jgi:hypothetical protein
LKKDTQKLLIDHFIEKGYTEVVDCSGTGLGLCLFKFRNATGQTLSVTTANNAPEEESLVFGWSLESEKQSSTKTR